MHTTTLATAPRIAAAGPQGAYWILRLGAAACFIGHGAFGFITKAAWLPYFGVVGISEAWAWRLMPMIGAVDLLAGFAVLFAPRGLPLAYMVVWGTWTALLRPLAGEGAFEALERAGNYGVPLALLLLTSFPRSFADLGRELRAATPEARSLARARMVLKWTTVLLLAGHGALGALTGKPELSAHYAAIGLPGSTTAIVGWFELGLAVAIALRPMAGLLLLAAAWKLKTEALFVVAGAPVWEFVERGGSVAAPLALALLLIHRGDEPSASRGSSPGPR